MPTQTAQQTVLDTLRQLSGDVDAAGAALQWIEAPDTALALALVIEGALLLLPTLRTVAADGATALDAVAPSAEVITGLQAMQNVLSHPSKSPPALKPLQRPAATRLQPFRGVMSSHPLYTLLGSWHWRNANAAHDPVILKAVAMVVLFAKARAQELAAEQAGSSPIYDACTALRELVHDHQILADRQQANDWIRIPTSSERASQVDAIRRIIEPVLRHHDLLVAPAQQDDEGSGETYSPPPQKLRLDLGDTLQIQSVTRLRTTTVEALKRSGLSLAEFDPQEEYVEWTETGEDDPLDLTPPMPRERSLAEQVLRTRALISRRERSMQLLAADWTRLTEAEVARLWQALRADCKSQDPATRETAALLGLALWTSHPLQTEDGGGLCAMTVLSHAQDAPQVPSPHPLLLLDRWVLRLPVRRPAGQPVYRGVDRSKARPCADAIDVPLPVVLRPVIDALPSVQRLSPHPRKTPVDAYEIKPGPLQQQAAAWLRDQVRQTSGRLTLSAVGQWMFRRLVEQRRDHALASLATGRPHLLADTGLHYLHVPTGDLVRWIRQEQDRAWGALQQADPRLGENDGAHPASAIEPDAPDIGVGAPIVPLDRTVQALAHSLDQALTHARSTPLADDALLILHNAFTQYVHALLRFSLGLRDVGQPLPNWNQIDGHHGVVLLSDKDDISASATRLAPLCTTALEQLRVYARHARATLTRLTPETLISPPPVLFYLRRVRGRLECIDHPTREMHAALEQVTGYTLPRNTSRHWLRSRLVQMGLSGELIEFFMGHWQRGAQPWGRYSALPARRVIESLRDPIEQLVREAGFHVVRGWA
ncbi:MAG: DNA breaking-rejoining enzyme, catalytic core [Betaproteobacteria bacterium]|nr:DNA breaking-rejoining enzyme, catalytic core [Betaproteobacteria bacterium]MDE2268535.1 DNA breaking-rejoining enzyme, catalytic core [Betaproteobacteria bacterium]